MEFEVYDNLFKGFGKPVSLGSTVLRLDQFVDDGYAIGMPFERVLELRVDGETTGKIVVRGNLGLAQSDRIEGIMQPSDDDSSDSDFDSESSLSPADQVTEGLKMWRDQLIARSLSYANKDSAGIASEKAANASRLNGSVPLASGFLTPGSLGDDSTQYSSGSDRSELSSSGGIVHKREAFVGSGSDVSAATAAVEDELKKIADQLPCMIKLHFTNECSADATSQDFFFAITSKNISGGSVWQRPMLAYWVSKSSWENFEAPVGMIPLSHITEITTGLVCEHRRIKEQSNNDENSVVSITVSEGEGHHCKFVVLGFGSRNEAAAWGSNLDKLKATLRRRKI